MQRPTIEHQPYSALCGHDQILRLGTYRPGDALQPWIERGFLRMDEQWRDPTLGWLPIGTSEPPVSSDRRVREVITIDRAALAAYVPQAEEKVPGLAAAWLFEIRTELEKTGVLTTAAWCVSCGAGCVDHRPSPPEIRRWCDACGRRRHPPGWMPWRQCAASDCDEWFQTTRGNLLYCGDTCSKAERRRLASTRGTGANPGASDRQAALQSQRSQM